MWCLTDVLFLESHFLWVSGSPSNIMRSNPPTLGPSSSLCSHQNRWQMDVHPFKDGMCQNYPQPPDMCRARAQAADFLKSEELLWANFAAKTLRNSGASVEMDLMDPPTLQQCFGDPPTHLRLLWIYLQYQTKLQSKFYKSIHQSISQAMCWSIYPRIYQKKVPMREIAADGGSCWPAFPTGCIQWQTHIYGQ